METVSAESVDFLTSAWDVLAKFAAAYGLRVLGALAILVFGRMAIGIAIGIVRRALKRSQMDETLSRFFLSLTKIALMAIMIIAILATLGIETASFVAILGAAGLAIGFALQGSLSNLASGVMLIMFRPFKAGDYVEAGGVSGSVQSVQIFNTVLHTPDNKMVIVPNSQIVGGSITNYSALDTRRCDMVFGIGYGDDILKAKQVLERILSEEPRVLTDPVPVIAVSELADSSVNLVVRPWVKTADYWGVFFDLTEKVKLTFDAEGISIPFPQRDVHMHQVNG